MLLGLFGEVGSVMSTVKKPYRERGAYAAFHSVLIEELGDILWYFAAVSARLGVNVEEVLSAVEASSAYQQTISAGGVGAAVSIGPVASVDNLNPIDESLLKLGVAAANLLSVDEQDDHSALLSAFAMSYLQVVQASGISFSEIIVQNREKTRGRFVETDLDLLPTFDDDFPAEEQLPRKFEIRITQRKSGQSYLQWNGVFIGEPLTDNIADRDDYRFHDVFHFAHAAILHWSPTFRALIKQKRKKRPHFRRSGRWREGDSYRRRAYRMDLLTCQGARVFSRPPAAVFRLVEDRPAVRSRL